MKPTDRSAHIQICREEKLDERWLWGSVRYSTGMIFLVIIPVHFAYNSIWLLFEGNWNNPPVWAIYALPALEFVFGLVIVILRDGKPKNILTIS